MAAFERIIEYAKTLEQKARAEARRWRGVDVQRVNAVASQAPSEPVATCASASRLTVDVDRDSVCAGDDCESHSARFEIAPDATVAELLARAVEACPLASIAGGEATWLVDTQGPGEGCIAVVAQQWPAPRLLLDEGLRVDALFGTRAPTLHFRYWCQADPEAAFEAMRAGRPLPPRD